MRLSCVALLPLTLLACSGTSTSTDAGTTTDARADAPADVTPATCSDEGPPQESLYPAEIFVRPGTSTDVDLRTATDRCTPFTAMATSSAPMVASTDATTYRIGTDQAHTRVVVRAGSMAGDAEVRVGNAVLRVHVMADALPACPTDTTAVMGTLRAGQTVRGATGTPLALASVGAPMQATATEVPPTEVTVRCAADQVPTGYTAVGPAVRFDPGVLRAGREIPFTVPINPARVPVGYEMQVEVSYSGPAFRTPRIVPVADLHLTNNGNALTFRAPRLGTWQAVVRTDLGQRRTRRRFTYHGIVGFSMGAAGTGTIGTRNLDRFDFVAPLGGPIDWNYQGHYIHDFHVAGFCTAAERAADPTGCARGSSVDRTPQVYDILERRQHFEEWFYPDGWDGQGGSFSRESYTQIFRDLTRMFGNAVMPSGATGVLPRGVPDGELVRSNAQRCSTPVVINGYYDARYNPDGSLPVITFCDGTNVPGHIGRWDGGVGDFPMEITLAVDVNRNGRRDAGEPVLHQQNEPFRDVGTDGRPSTMETGYDAMANLDPAGDDYDRQFNPGGTEGNWLREEGEPYDDLGVDGVRCPSAGACMYDLGEGNGRYDTTTGAQRFLDVNPRNVVARAPAASLDRTEFWIDGGVRDLFLFGVVANHFAGAFAQRGYPLHYFNNFASIGAGRVPETDFPFMSIDWAHLPSHVMLRYGDLDAPEQALVNGDGGHVGTPAQITNRLYSALWWMAARWPGGDRAVAPFQFNRDDAGRCANGYACTFDFTSERARRTGPVSVYLPPGYHDPANAGVRYPVVFVLHGYGMDPQGLLPTGFLIGNYMVAPQYPEWQRPQKFIMVFPDGRCREGDGCLRGTFYTDSPVGNAQMESYFLDLYDFVDRTYRVKSPEEVEVVR